MSLFEGMKEAHGTYQVESKQENGKMVGQALTLREPVSISLWERHLKGEESLGIVPINRDSKAKWGAIDVDEYPLDHAALIAQIREAEIPLNVFRSKSGGAHLILILSDFLPASQVVSTLKSWCALLKLGKVEIFPKQTQLKVEDGDLGNWLNMPYFGDTRPLLDDKAQPVSVNNFPSTVKVVDPKELKEHKLKLEDSIIKDGPP